MVSARVEYWCNGAWVFWRIVEAPTLDRAREGGLAVARDLWRRGVAGVKVTLTEPVVCLERMR